MSIKIYLRNHRARIVAVMTVALICLFGLVAWFALLGVTSGDTRDQREDNGRELKLLHIIMRHGIRTPADTYPTDPHINDTLFPVGWGQLTNEGKLQLYHVGQFFRARYNSFLGSYYFPDDFYTQSTDVDRTKASMQLVNAGLWPPNEDQKWGPLDWQPVPVHSEPLSEDSLLLVRRPCPVYHQERDKIIASSEVQAKFKEYQGLFNALSNYSGRPVKDFDDIQDIFSTLKAEEGFGLKLPEWTKQYYPEKMLEPTIYSYILNAYNDKMNRLKGGVLLKKILTDWQTKANDTISPQSRKAFLYGGHDSTIVNFMRTLKVWDPQLPDYAITIFLELSIDKDGTYGVEVFLRNTTSVPPYKLTIPGCDSFCPLSKLTNLTANVIPGNWDEECKGSDESYTVPPPYGP